MDEVLSTYSLVNLRGLWLYCSDAVAADDKVAPPTPITRAQLLPRMADRNVT